MSDEPPRFSRSTLLEAALRMGDYGEPVDGLIRIGDMEIGPGGKPRFSSPEAWARHLDRCGEKHRRR